jgi:hypothetical protein
MAKATPGAGAAAAAGSTTEKPAAGAEGKGAEGAAAGAEGAKGAEGKGAEGEGAAAGEGEGKGAEGAAGAEGKSAEGKGGKDGKGEGDGKGGKGSEEQGAPEKYELKIPDDGILDARDQAAIESYARANGLSNDDAQALLEDHAQQLRTQSETWLNETKKDKTYGGAKLAETQKLARSAINRVRPEGHPRREAFDSLLKKGGVFNHLEVVSFLADLGRMMGEDGGAGASGGEGKGKKSLEQKLYTHPTSQVTGDDE